MTKTIIGFLCGVILMGLAPMLYANSMTGAKDSSAGATPESSNDVPDMQGENRQERRQWCREHREECKAKREKWCQDNPEKCKEKAKKWCTNHPGFCKAIKDS